MRRWGLYAGTAGLACAALVWHAAGGSPISWAQEPIGRFYTHRASEFPFARLGDVPPTQEVPRSLADDRVRQYDELDRPRFAQRLTHRGAQLNSERFTVVATSGQADAELALREFTAAWESFGKIADAFTRNHRNPDFAIGQVMIVIDSEPLRDQQPSPTVQPQNGQTLVYINVGPGQPPLAQQVSKLHQGAVLTLLHLAELDRKLPYWTQEGLAEYTAQKLEQARLAELERARQELEAGLDPDLPDTVDPELTLDDEPLAADDGTDMDDEASPVAPQITTFSPAGAQYWRTPRSAPDRLAPPVEAVSYGESFQRVRFLLEGDDAAHAPAFLSALAQMAEESTDRAIELHTHRDQMQLLDEPQATPIDDLVSELDETYRQWQTDPLRGQPLFLPGGDIPDPAMLAREKDMEIVLKLAQRVQLSEETDAVRPRVTEFSEGAQREVASSPFTQPALDIDQLYRELTRPDIAPWATLDATGNLLLWTNHERLSEVLGLEEGRYETAWRDGRWVLVAPWDDTTQLEAWLEPNANNPERPLVKFAARQRVLR